MNVLVELSGFHQLVREAVPHLQRAGEQVGELAKPAADATALRASVTQHLALANQQLDVALSAYTTETAWTATHGLAREVRTMGRAFAPESAARLGAAEVSDANRRLVRMAGWDIPHVIPELADATGPGVRIGSSSPGGSFRPFEATAIEAARLDEEAAMAALAREVDEAGRAELATGHLLQAMPADDGPVRIPGAARPQVNHRQLDVLGTVPFENRSRLGWEFPATAPADRTISASGSSPAIGYQPVGTHPPERGEVLARLHYLTQEGQLSFEMKAEASAHFTNFDEAMGAARGNSPELAKVHRFVTPREAGGWDLVTAVIKGSSARLGDEPISAERLNDLRNALGREADVPAGIEELSRRVDGLVGHDRRGQAFERSFHDVEPSLVRTSMDEIEFDLPTVGAPIGSVTLDRTFRHPVRHQMLAGERELWTGDREEILEMARKRVGMHLVIPVGQDRYAIVGVGAADDISKQLWRKTGGGLDRVQMSIDDERAIQVSLKRDQYAEGRAMPIDISITPAFDDELSRLLRSAGDGPAGGATAG